MFFCFRIARITYETYFKTNSYKNVFKFTREYVSKNTAKFDVKAFSESLYKRHFLAGDNKNAIVAASKILLDV